MNRRMQGLGVLATAVIVGLLLVNIVREPNRQQTAQADYQAAAVVYGTDLYAVNCASCHGAAGEGLGVYRALDQDFVRQQDYRLLFNTISRGRYNTEMAAFSVTEGGLLTEPQIDTLVLMLQHGSWDTIAARVDELGLTPDESAVQAAQQTTLVMPVDGIDANTTLELFATHCTECHGENGEGSADAPILNTGYVQGLPAEQLYEIVTVGVRNTKMEGFADTLSDDERASLVYLLQNWDALHAGTDAVAAAPTPTEVVTETGEELFTMWCAICHGTSGEGSSIAPSLNDIPVVPADFIVSRVRGGKNAMPAFPEADLSNGKLAVIIAYAQENIFASALPQFSADELATGEALYVQHCAECHGQYGEGVENAGPNLVTLPPMRASEIINFVRVGSANAEAIPSSVVNDEDMRLIVAYIHSLNP